MILDFIFIGCTVFFPVVFCMIETVKTVKEIINE